MDWCSGLKMLAYIGVKLVESKDFPPGPGLKYHLNRDCVIDPSFPSPNSETIEICRTLISAERQYITGYIIRISPGSCNRNFLIMGLWSWYQSTPSLVLHVSNVGCIALELKCNQIGFAHLYQDFSTSTDTWCAAYTTHFQ